MVDKRDATYLHHDLITPHLLKHNADRDTTLKGVGSVVIPRKHVTKIQLDHKLQKLYDAETARRLPSEESKQ